MLRKGLEALLPAWAGASVVAGVDFFLSATWGTLAGRPELLGSGWVGTWLATLMAVIIWVLLRRGLTSSRKQFFWIGCVVAGLPLLVGLDFPFWLALLLASSACTLLFALRAAPRLPAPSTLACKLIIVITGTWTLATPWLAMQGEHPQEWSASSGPKAPTGSPDIILVSIDTCRADSVFGPDSATTPTLDRLRTEGLYSSFALSGSNQTIPGHLEMLTGLDAMSHGVRENRERPPAKHTLLAERMQAAGWETFGVVSNPLMGAEFGWTRGFDAFDDTLVLRGRLRPIHEELLNHGWTGWILGRKWSRRALSWVYADYRAVAARNHSTAQAVVDIASTQIDALTKQENPFFLFLHFMDPHSPYEAPAAQRTARSNLAKKKVPKRFLPAQGDRVIGSMLIDTEKALLNEDSGAMAAVDWYHSLYLEEVAEVDRALSQLIEKLEANERPTIVLVTGDHGEHFGEQGWMRHANTLLEPNLRVPFILWAPGKVRPGTIEGVPHLTDVVPTLLALAGIPLLESFDGRPVHLGAMPNRIHVATDQDEVAVRWNDLKWTGEWSTADQIEQAPSTVRLIHLQEDPSEMLNLAEDIVPRNLAEKISQTIARDAHSGLTTDKPPSITHEALLEELGYAGDD
ncbi:MAG TPA: hypothetical protein DDW23_08815 [Planctomycetes bacterium]|nr:hypothetical protein [Planctomycetota bacterium]